MLNPIQTNTAFADLLSAVEQFTTLSSITITDEMAAYHEVVSQMHALCAAVRRAENQGMPRGDIINAVLPARLLHESSPFVRRLQTWPRGYPGDFETIEYICNAVVRAPRTSVGYFIEYHCLHDITAQQHRNKVTWQADRILEAAFHRPSANILSVACGASPDVRRVQEFIATKSCSIYLNDMDAEAIAFSKAHLPALRSATHDLPGDVFNLTRRLKELPAADLILAGGLFDYLDDRQIVWLLPRLFRQLAAGGKICFTNVAKENPNRVWLDYFGGWHLIERSESDVADLISSSGLSHTSTTHIERDTTGLTLLVSLTRT
jgi:SAM-dependent methyltransferase